MNLKHFFKITLSNDTDAMIKQIPVELPVTWNAELIKWLEARYEQFVEDEEEKVIWMMVDSRPSEYPFGFNHYTDSGRKHFINEGFICVEPTPMPSALTRFENACIARGMVKVGHKKYRVENTGDTYVFREQHSSGGTAPAWRELLWSGINIVFEGMAAHRMARKMPRVFQPRLHTLEDFGGKDA